MSGMLVLADNEIMGNQEAPVRNDTPAEELKQRQEK